MTCHLVPSTVACMLSQLTLCLEKIPTAPIPAAGSKLYALLGTATVFAGSLDAFCGAQLVGSDDVTATVCLQDASGLMQLVPWSVNSYWAGLNITDMTVNHTWQLQQSAIAQRECLQDN